MTASAAPLPAPRTTPPLADWAFGSWWPDRLAARPRLVGAALGVGALAAVVAPYRAPGLGLFLVLVAAVAVVIGADQRLRTLPRLAAATLCLLLGSVVVLRDAEWVVALCLLAAVAVAAVALVGPRTFAGVALAGVAVPLAGLRGLPWLGRSVAAGRTRSTSWALVRTVLVSALLVVVFGALFASADALFSSWVDAVVPDLSIGGAFVRLFVLATVAGGTLACAYVGLNPPRSPQLPAPKPVARTFEWLLPVGLVVGLFAAFVAAQAAVMFGGHAYLARTAGVTYADYVHQGFAQMNVATLLTLGVVAVAVAKAPRETVRQRSQLRVALGLLCALALVVVGSALYRMHVYEQAYGFTRLRLLVSVFEGWLGLLLVLVVVAGVRFRASWLPTATVLTGAAALLALAWSNPDASIARHNLDRYAQTGRIDVGYLSGLSADAAPALAGLPAGLAACVQHAVPHDDWLAWNIGRSRAADLAAPTGPCLPPTGRDTPGPAAE